MIYATEHIATALKAARKSKRLSQREMSTKSGVPQSHISKIENGAVDLRASSLVALARVLDLELLLVPRNAVPAVNSIVRSIAQRIPLDGKAARRIRKELAGLQRAISQLPIEMWSKSELEKIQRQARELQKKMRLSRSEIDSIRDTFKTVRAFINKPENMNAIRHALSQFQDLGNTSAQGRDDGSEIDSRHPAYSLDEDDDG